MRAKNSSCVIIANYIILCLFLFCFFFFFQAEDGIRDLTVTGVQTCALPISLFASNLWQRHAPGETVYTSDIGYRNGILRLDPATFAPLPWTPATAHLLADLHSEDGSIVGTPRAVLRRVLDDAAALGVVPVLGSELEFYLYRPTEGGGYQPADGPQAWFSVDA